MVRIVARAALDMETYAPGGTFYYPGVPVADITDTRMTVTYPSAKLVSIGSFDYSPFTGGTGTIRAFKLYENGRLVLDMSGLDTSLARFTLASESPFPDSFYEVILAGNDVINGSRQGDIISGHAGNDAIRGGGGNDVLTGGDGRDRIEGGAGKDRIEGGAGKDRLLGNGGADTLAGGDDNDILTGGAGSDVFEFNSGDGRDIIRDFNLRQGDKLLLSPFLGDFGDSVADVVRENAVVRNGSVVLNFGDGDVLIVQGVRSVSALVQRGLLDSGDDPFGF